MGLQGDGDMTRAAPLGEECAQPIASAEWGTLFCSRRVGHDDTHEAVFIENMAASQPCHGCNKPVRWHKDYIYDVFSCWEHLRKARRNGEG